MDEKPLRFLDEAVVEAQKASIWYWQHSERAGRRFQQAFEKEYLLDTKCIPLKRFPYIIVYRELEEEIQIVAVAHAHRRQAYWKKRL
jgi:hypothetical protein